MSTDTIYTVRSGDTLWGIAQKYGVDVKELQKNNGVDDPTNLKAGKQLTIHGVPETVTHTVRSGDTLGAIAKKFGVSVHELAQVNNITDPNKIYVGQRIQIATAKVNGTSDIWSTPQDEAKAQVPTTETVVTHGDTDREAVDALKEGLSTFLGSYASLEVDDFQNTHDFDRLVQDLGAFADLLDQAASTQQTAMFFTTELSKPENQEILYTLVDLADVHEYDLGYDLGTALDEIGRLVSDSTTLQSDITRQAAFLREELAQLTTDSEEGIPATEDEESAEPRAAPPSPSVGETPDPAAAPVQDQFPSDFPEKLKSKVRGNLTVMEMGTPVTLNIDGTEITLTQNVSQVSSAALATTTVGSIQVRGNLGFTLSGVLPDGSPAQTAFSQGEVQSLNLFLGGRVAARLSADVQGTELIKKPEAFGDQRAQLLQSDTGINYYLLYTPDGNTVAMKIEVTG